MLSYMLPTVEENSKNSRNLSLNLNLQNTTQSQTSSDTDQEHPEEEHEDVDENTKLLNIERQDYASKFNRNGNLIKNGGNKINYKMNITSNGILSNSDLINNHNNINNINNNSIIKNGDSKDDTAETDSVATSIATNENTVNNNNNEETNSSNNGDSKKIIKMTKLGSKNVTLKR